MNINKNIFVFLFFIAVMLVGIRYGNKSKRDSVIKVEKLETINSAPLQSELNTQYPVYYDLLQKKKYIIIIVNHDGINTPQRFYIEN